MRWLEQELGLVFVDHLLDVHHALGGLSELAPCSILILGLVSAMPVDLCVVVSAAGTTGILSVCPCGAIVPPSDRRLRGRRRFRLLLRHPSLRREPLRVRKSACKCALILARPSPCLRALWRDVGLIVGLRQVASVIMGASCRSIHLSSCLAHLPLVCHGSPRLLHIMTLLVAIGHHVIHFLNLHLIKILMLHLLGLREVLLPILIIGLVEHVDVALSSMDGCVGSIQQHVLRVYISHLRLDS